MSLHLVIPACFPAYARTSLAGIHVCIPQWMPDKLVPVQTGIHLGMTIRLNFDKNRTYAVGTKSLAKVGKK